MIILIVQFFLNFLTNFCVNYQLLFVKLSSNKYIKFVAVLIAHPRIRLLKTYKPFCLTQTNTQQTVEVGRQIFYCQFYNYSHIPIIKKESITFYILETVTNKKSIVSRILKQLIKLGNTLHQVQLTFPQMAIGRQIARQRN